MADYRRPPYNRQAAFNQQECMRQPEPSCPAPCAVDERTACKEIDMDHFPVAMLYVPWQKWCQTYELDRALRSGTIFPDLDRPFRGVRKGGART